MSNTGEYRVSKNALIISGAVILLVGLLALPWTGVIGIVVAVVGLILLLVGLLRPKG